MAFLFPRTIRFQDTDAAGVVYFAQGLAICHEAYEESLVASGIDPRSFFRQGDFIFPITHAEIDFFQPMHCGDRIQVQLLVEMISEFCFEVRYQIQEQFQEQFQDSRQEQIASCDDQSLLLKPCKASNPSRCLAQALTRHVCLQTPSRRKSALPSYMQQWLSIYSSP